MAALIKSTQVTGQPIVLNHERRWTESPVFETPVQEEEPSSMPVAFDVEASDAALPAADVDAVETPPEESYLSYQEYKERFEAELQELEEEAKEKGFERGRAEGIEQVTTEYSERITALTNLMASLRAALDDGLDNLSDIGVEIVNEAVSKIIGESVVERDAIVAAVRQVIRRAKERTKLVVRVSPNDWSILEGHEAELTEGFSVGSIEIVADDRVQVGGCLLETPAGTLDGRIEVQLERLRDAMENARAEEDEDTVA